MHSTSIGWLAWYARSRPAATCIGIAAALFAAAGADAQTPPDEVHLTGLVRDFASTHPDFAVVPTDGLGQYAANVEPTLPVNGRPVFAAGGFKVQAPWLNDAAQTIAPHMFGVDGSGGDADPETCGSEVDILLVVADAGALSGQDAQKKIMLESWGHVVSVIDDEATQAQVDAAVALHGLVYISEECDHNNVGDKYKYVPIGVVNEDKDLSDSELGFSSSKRTWTGSTINIVNNTHPITESFPLGLLQITSEAWNMHRADGSFAPGGVSLAEKPSQAGKPALMVVERGELMHGGFAAPARRVRLPWGNHSVDFFTINANGLALMQRSACWAGSNNPSACGDVNDVAGVAGVTSDGAITSAATFDEWFRDVLGVSQTMPQVITMTRNVDDVYEYLNSGFFPIDDKLMGNEGDEHNRYFTYSIRAQFTYESCSGQFIGFQGGDGTWLYVDGQLALDLGGVMPTDEQVIELDRLGLTDGQTYEVSLFYADRHDFSAVFRLRTNVLLTTDSYLPPVLAMFD